MKRIPIILCASAILMAAGILFGASPLQVKSGTWIAAGSMNSARIGAAAVLLQDGRILVTGGTGASGPANSAEFFAANGTFSLANPMNVPRSGHVAVVLRNGRVLVAGGTTTGGAATNSAEIYDPNASTWTSVTGGMIEARSGATAVVLQDGRVLVAGGQNGSLISSTIEIFDPSLGTFAAAGMMSSQRTQHAMTLLQDGRVLIAGGNNGTAPVASTDIFSPVAGVSAGPTLSVARFGHSATTLLNGQVVVIGGNNGNANPAKMDVTPAEMFDPTAATPAFTTLTNNLATPREGHLAFLLPNNNNVLIVGGTSGGASGGATLASAELFTPQTSAKGVWTYVFGSTGSMATARSGTSGAANQLSSTSLVTQTNGVLLIAGGKGANGNALNSSEAYGFATVQTDRGDYPPGTTVTITGSGWQPGATVMLTLVESPLIDSDGPYRVAADANGNISNSSFTTDSRDAGVKFTLTAAGSGSQAQTTFVGSSATIPVSGSNARNATASSVIALTATTSLVNKGYTDSTNVSSAQFNNTSIAGDLLVIGGGTNPNASGYAYTAPPTFSEGNAMSSINSFTASDGNLNQILWTNYGINGGDRPTIACHTSTTISGPNSNYAGCYYLEFSGVNALDQSAASGQVNYSGSSITSASITTSHANEILVCFGSQKGSGGFTGAGSGWSGTGFGSQGVEYQIVSSTGTYSCSMNLNGVNADYAMTIAGFYESSGSSSPAISSLSVTSGPVGASVTITGSNFGSAQGGSTITFNGTAAAVTGWNATSISTSVPAGATTGNVVVSVAGAASNGVYFTVMGGSTSPTISSLSVYSGLVGSPVTITGTNFGSAQGGSTLTFNGTTAAATGWTATSITTSVPAGATTGNVAVSVAGVVSNGVNFAVTNGLSPSRVQGTACEGSGASLNCTLPASVTSGDVLVWAATASYGSSAPTVTASDNCGGTYTVVDTANKAGTTNTVAQGYSTGSHGTCIVTFSASDSGGFVTGVADEITAATLDKHSLLSGQSVNSGGTVTTTSVTTTAADYAWSYAVDAAASGGNPKGSSPFVTHDSNSVFGEMAADYTQATSGAVTATWTMSSTTSDAVVGMMAFTQPGGGSTYPTISSLSIPSGPVGTPVTITGTNFGSTQGGSTVTFNGTTAAVTAWTANGITTSVPAGATTGNVVVSVAGAASNGVYFTVMGGSTSPTISSLSVYSGLVGSPVTITGTNFGSAQGGSTLTFNGTTAAATGWTATSITTSVPAGATTGNVVVSVSGVASNGVNFSVTTGGGGTSAAPSRVQGIACEGSGASLNCTPPANVTTGDILVWAVTAAYGSSAPTITASDNCGGTYTVVDTATKAGTTSTVAQGYSTGSHGSCIVTFSAAGGAAFETGVVDEITSATLDKHSLLSGQSVTGGGALTTTSVTTTSKDYTWSYAVEADAHGGAPPVSSPYALHDSNSIFGEAAADYTQTSSGAVIATWTLSSTTTDAVVGMMTFTGSGGL